MRRSAYLKQLRTDLEKWATAGLIPSDRIPTLLADAGPTETERSISHILAFFGAVMLACAAVAFVGANWQVLPRLLKLALLLLTMWGIYGASLAALGRGQALFAQAAILLGLAMFGANIMLVGQIYHINAGWPAGVLIWALGALLTAFVVPSRAAGAFAAGLFTIWSVAVVMETHRYFHWPYLLVLVGLVTFGVWQRWAPQIHLALIGFGIWSVVNAISLCEHFHIDGALAIYALICISIALWLAGRLFSQGRLPFGNVLSGYGLFAMAGMAFALQWADNGPQDRVTLLVAGAGAIPVFLLAGAARARPAHPEGLRSAELLIVLGLVTTGLAVLLTGYPPHGHSPYVLALLYLLFVVWLINYGLARRRSFPVNLGIVAFAAEVFVLYFMTFDTLLDRSALFAIGGVLFIGAAVVLERMRRRLLKAAT